MLNNCGLVIVIQEHIHVVVMAIPQLVVAIPDLHCYVIVNLEHMLMLVLAKAGFRKHVIVTVDITRVAAAAGRVMTIVLVTNTMGVVVILEHFLQHVAVIQELLVPVN